MAARARWKGVITFGEVNLPVKLYSAVVDKAVHFRLLHDQDQVPIEQRMVNPQTGEPVPAERVRKGVRVGPEEFVLIRPEEQEAVEPPPSRSIHVERFVAPALINHQWYVRPYWLGPDAREDDYWAFVEALGRTGREGVARWVMRKRAYAGALRVEQGRLMLITLRTPEEVITPEELPSPPGRAISDREVGMAEQLVAALADAFEPGEYRDEYRARVMELIEAKAEGKALPGRKVERKKVDMNLADSLKASIAAARKEKSRGGN